jgi:hypothetical protein
VQRDRRALGEVDPDLGREEASRSRDAIMRRHPSEARPRQQPRGGAGAGRDRRWLERRLTTALRCGGTAPLRSRNQEEPMEISARNQLKGKVKQGVIKATEVMIGK